MDTFMSNLDVHRVGVSYALEIGFRSRDPEMAARIANATVEAYMNEQLATRVDDAENGLQWLEDRIEHIRMQMNDAAIAAQTFRSKHDYTIGARTPSSGGDTPAEAAGGKGVTLDELEATADSYKKMYESFLQAFTTSANQRPSPDARVITVATSPLVPSGPRKKLILAFGAMSGIMLGLGLAFVRNLLDISVRNPQQLRDALGLDCLGELPAIPRRWGGFGRCDEVARAPGSPFGRSIRGIKAAVGIAALDRPIRFVGVTSVSPGEGKSMLAGNLATAWAMSGARTLLIDADAEHSVFSKPAQHDAGGERAGKGPEWAGQIRAHPGQAFDILSSGTVERYDLLAAGHAQETFACLGGHEMVIVDLPPFTSGNHGVAAAAQLDGVVIAVEWGRTSQDALAEQIRALVAARAPVLGVVLTKVRKSSNDRLRRRARRTPR
jgi:Mrp family chromosome partitioning ATPase